MTCEFFLRGKRRPPEEVAFHLQGIAEKGVGTLWEAEGGRRGEGSIKLCL